VWSSILKDFELVTVAATMTAIWLVFLGFVSVRFIQFKDKARYDQ